MRLKSNIKSKKRQSIMFVIGLLSEPLEDLVSGGCISEDDTCVHSQDILDMGHMCNTCSALLQEQRLTRISPGDTPQSHPHRRAEMRILPNLPGRKWLLTMRRGKGDEAMQLLQCHPWQAVEEISGKDRKPPLMAAPVAKSKTCLEWEGHVLTCLRGSHHGSLGL